MSIAERLTATVGDSQPVRLESLGTMSDLTTQATELAASPQAPHLASAFCAQLQTETWTQEHAQAFLRFVAGLNQQRSYLALRETADILLNQQQALNLAGATLHDTLLPNAETIAGSPLLAGLQLDIALEVVARTTVAPYKLLALLTGPVDDYPEDFDDPLARALGVASDIWDSPADRQHFAATLKVLVTRGSEDAAHESALEQLRNALTAENKTDLLSKIHLAREQFDALSRQIEGRDDAAAFANTCTALIAFDQADKTALEASARKAHATAERRALLTHGMHSRHQNTARHVAELAWTSLAWRLETAAIELEEDAFLDTWVAVDAIINVYQADRQFTNLDTVNSLIRPRIINEIARREAMAHQLERAVAIDKKRENPSLPHEVYELLDFVHRARSAGRETGNDSEESSHDDTYLRALLGPAASAVAELPKADQVKLETAARQTFVGSFTGDRPANDVIDQLTARLLAELGENHVFVGSAKSNFSLLVLHTVRFLVHVGDNRQPYTRPVVKGASAPLEVELQKHFHQFLSATELAGRVGMEHSNIAGGRADVITTFDGAQRYVTEVKRELENASHQNLEADYLAQALEYQSTNHPLGQLLVLDLTDQSSGTPHLNDSIWVTHRRDTEGRVTASAVVAVVHGNRPTPSAMS